MKISKVSKVANAVRTDISVIFDVDEKDVKEMQDALRVIERYKIMTSSLKECRDGCDIEKVDFLVDSRKNKIYAIITQAAIG